MGKRKIKIGLMGLGTIGGGVATILNKNGNLISDRLDIDLSLVRVLERDRSRAAALKIDSKLVTDDPDLILNDPEIDLVIELLGGIEPARTFITRALEKGKYVVTANKDLIAKHGEELFNLAREKNKNIFYEASVGGGIPLIRPLKYSLVADQIKRVVGIVNGTTNYIFTRMSQDNLSLDEALLEAQKLGFAEANPTNDIEGFDAAYKLVILSGLAFEKKVTFDQVYVQGICGVTYEDIAYAREIGYVVKLLAIGEKMEDGLALRVHPTLVPIDHPLASVLHEFNAIFIEGEMVGDLMFYGKGAGALPTATAILSDVAEAARHICYQPSNGVIEKNWEKAKSISIDQVTNRFYLRFLAEDRPGVFAALANAFGDELVSLDMIIQKRRIENLAEIVLVTHDVKEQAFMKAFNKAKGLSSIKPNPSIIRLLV